MPKINFSIKELECIYSNLDIDEMRTFVNIEDKIRKVIPKYIEYDKKKK